MTRSRNGIWNHSTLFGNQTAQSILHCPIQTWFNPKSVLFVPITKLFSTLSRKRDSTLYDLVLFTTEDGASIQKMNKMQLFRDMSELYSQHFRFRAIVFTTTSELNQFFSNSSIIISDNFKYILSSFSPILRSSIEQILTDYLL